jgi:hypothetical protein
VAFSIDSAEGASIKACRRSCPIAIDRDHPEDQSSQDEFSSKSDVDDVKRRLERQEPRLELHDED